MANKKKTIKLALSMVIAFGFCMSLTSAINFHISKDILNGLETYSSDNIIPIHFADNGNDFGGFFYFSNVGKTSDEGETEGTEENTGEFGVSIDVNGEKEEYECSEQVKGFYYNAERGERLWPLDEDTKNKFGSNIQLSGGFFTVCNKSGYVAALKKCEDGALEQQGEEESKEYNICKEEARTNFELQGHGYYGQITHTYSGEMVLIAGVKYNPDSSTNFIKIDSNEGFSPSFERLGNQYPVGFIYDYNGGVGFIGCKATETNSIKNLISKYNYISEDSEDENKKNPLNSLFRVEGDNLEYNENNGEIGINCSGAVRDSLISVVIEGIVGMGQSGNKDNFGYIGNQRDPKMQYFTSAGINNGTIINYARKRAEILCRNKWGKTIGNIVCFQGTSSEINADDYQGKTLIVKNGDVKISPFDSSKTGHYDIFIDSGNLIIDESNIDEPNSKNFVFNTNGFRTDDDIDNFNSAVISDAGRYNGTGAGVGSFIRGNFIINGHIKSSNAASGLQNKYFIYGKISTRDNFDTLLETFKWRCENGIDTNGNSCPKSHREGDGWFNPYENAALIVIDQNYSSEFFNQS